MAQIHFYNKEDGTFLKSFPSQTSAEKEFNLYRGAIADMLRRKGTGKMLVSKEKHDIHPLFATSESQKRKGPDKLLSEIELRQKHDMFFMVHSFVKDIPEGKFIEESIMLKQLEILGKARYRDAISRPELKDYKGRVDGTTYYGSPDSIKKLKSEGVLQ